jgi:DNA-directed RNA polymerase specialized sigma24 family protein
VRQLEFAFIASKQAVNLAREKVRWEEKLKAEGLAPIERTYRTVSNGYVHRFTKINPLRSSGELSDYFSRCVAFTAQLKLRVKIWQLYSNGETFREIARRTGVPFGTVEHRIREIRKSMVTYEAVTEGEAMPPPEAKQIGDIVECFVEAQKQGRN